MQQSAESRLLDALSTHWIRAVTGVSGQTVADWRNGRMPSHRQAELAVAVRRLLPEVDEQDEAPRWAQRLMTRDEVHAYVDQVEARVVAAIRGDVDARADRLVERTVEAMIEELRGHAPQLFGGDAPDPAPSAG